MQLILIILLLLNLNLGASAECNCEGADVRSTQISLELNEYGDNAVCGKYADGCFRWFPNVRKIHLTNGYQECGENEAKIARVCCRKGWRKSTRCLRGESSQCSIVSDTVIRKYENSICGVSNGDQCYTWFRSGSELYKSEGYYSCNILERIIAEIFCCAVGPEKMRID